MTYQKSGFRFLNVTDIQGAILFLGHSFFVLRLVRSIDQFFDGYCPFFTKLFMLVLNKQCFTIQGHPVMFLMVTILGTVEYDREEQQMSCIKIHDLTTCRYFSTVVMTPVK